ncbi:hypothetical protein EME63_24420 [Klebsiella pneumoniae]|nr:hypothetical protein EME63_24420 [Klebsiella pneumoniae]TMZ21839.1 hypothetical protein EME70_24430 [Klebsiella pneumoniae]TMZ24274.1 hypothetical protein EME93_00020 [Klebsiella pneumoniae]
MFAGKKSAQIREILISESAWEEMTCLFAPSFALVMRWLHFLTQVTYYCMLPGMRKFAAFPQRELFSASQHSY